MTDLFAPPRQPRPSSPPAVAAIAATGRFVADPVGGASHFIHPCGRCGAAHAPFGSGVRLRAAIDAGNPALAGTWLCFGCLEEATPCRAS